MVRIGHGMTVGHHAGDTWAFEGVDGRDYAIIGTFMHDWAKVFDITQPSNPVLTDSVQLDARRINDVKIHPNNRIGVLTREGASTRRNGIVLLDLSTPAHPTILSEYSESLTGGVHNVWIDGETDLVYAVHNGTRDIRIIDISDPSNPGEVGRWGLTNEDRSLHDVIVQDGYAYLSYWNDGLIMLDVGAGTHGGSPREPTFVSRFQYPGGQTHTAWRHGRYLFIGDEIFPSDWDAARPIEARGYIHVVDYSDPDNPVEVARYEVPESGAHNFWVEDDLLYVGYYQAGLRVLDVSGELRGDLYRQGRQLGAYRTSSPDAITPNWSMTWGAQIFKGNIITSDLNSGLWIVKFTRTNTVF
jgi:choice-of-anchor B domain-containing protein